MAEDSNEWPATIKYLMDHSHICFSTLTEVDYGFEAQSWIKLDRLIIKIDCFDPFFFKLALNMNFFFPLSYHSDVKMKFQWTK